MKILFHKYLKTKNSLEQVYVLHTNGTSTNGDVRKILNNPNFLFKGAMGFWVAAEPPVNSYNPGISFAFGFVNSL